MSAKNRPIVDDEVLYYGGTEELATSLQQPYVRHFLESPGKVLDVGCGRGAMLTLLKQAGVEAYGIDLSPTAVKYCRSKGLEAVHADLLSHVTRVKSGSLGGIFCAHVIEHMSPPDALRFLEESSRVLKKGAKLILITPNPKDLRTTERFWLDITHVRPYPEKLLRFLLVKAGFARVEATTSPEPAENIGVRLAKILMRIWFIGYMFTGDLVVIAKR